MLANTQPAERPAMALTQLYSDADPCGVPDEPRITDYEPCHMAEYTPIKWEDNRALRCFVELVEVDDQPELWDGSCNMVPFTLIDWISNKAIKLYDDYIESDFDFDKQPNWEDLPF
jgi:hypothetical protein